MSSPPSRAMATIPASADAAAIAASAGADATDSTDTTADATTTTTTADATTADADAADARRHARKKRKREWKEAQRAEREKEAAPLLLGPASLRFLRPFWTGPPNKQVLHLDPPCAADADAIEVVHRDDDAGLIVVNKPAPLTVLKDQVYRRNNLRQVRGVEWEIQKIGRADD